MLLCKYATVFFLTCLFFIPKSVEECFLFLFFFCTRPRLIGSCVMVCFLPAVLSRVHMVCEGSQGRFLLWTWLALTFIFIGTRALPYLPLNPPNAYLLTKRALINVEWISDWVNLWGEWKGLPTGKEEGDGFTKEVTTRGKEEKGRRAVLRALCISDVEGWLCNIMFREVGTTRGASLFFLMHSVLLLFGWFLLYFSLFLLSVRSQMWFTSWNCLYPIDTENCITWYIFDWGTEVPYGFLDHSEFLISPIPTPYPNFKLLNGRHLASCSLSLPKTRYMPNMY